MIQNKDLKKFDVSKMYEVYDNWPKIAKKSYNTKLKSIESLKINHIVFAGMGGSGALGDIFRTILDKTSIHTSIAKGYVLPKTVDEDTLVVVTSVSGNTQETLSILKHANNLKCNLIAFSSGGKIENYCKKEKIEYRKIKQFHSPRASFVSFLYTILKILEPILPIKKNEILNSIKELEKISQIISSKNLTKSNSSLELANWITEVPVIYYPNGFQSVAIANLHPESNIFLAGAKGSPKPKLHPGKTTPVVSEFERSLISSSVISARWSTLIAPFLIATLSPSVEN